MDELHPERVPPRALDLIARAVRTAERGKLDFVFFADAVNTGVMKNALPEADAGALLDKAVAGMDDALLKAATLVAVTGDATPDAFVIHPTDWQNLVLTRTTDGIYILGNPGNPPANPTLWGLPVRVSSTVAAAAGTAAVGAFRTMAAAVYNGGVVVETATEHSTYFTENKIALSLRQRMSAVHYRPSAFAKVTGL